MANRLSDDEVRKALDGLSHWRTVGGAIERNFEFPDFKHAMTFVNKIAEAAERENHHPDITINYNKVKLSLVSHDAGGLTRRDFKMATAINEIAG